MVMTEIKLLRLRRGMLQVQLAQQAPIARGRLSEIECGLVTPRPDELERLARVLGVSVETLTSTAAPPDTQRPLPHPVAASTGGHR